jgi:hypothetical protein
MIGALAARGRPRALQSTSQRMPQDTSALGTAASRPRTAGLLGGAGPALSLGGGGAATPSAPGSARAELEGALGGPVQARLAVQPAGDNFEREADAASENVLAGRPVGRVSRLAASPGECPACAAATAQGVQRKCATCAQRDSDAGAASDPAGLDGGRAERAMAGAGAGSPLNPEMRGAMERRFGADFGGVRVHRGPAADEANRALGARAFTRGSDVYLGRGASPNDPELMAHELTHVVQQSAGEARTVQRQPAPGSDDPELAAQLAEQIQATEESARLAGTPEDHALFTRTALLLKNTHDPLKNQAELDAFIHEAEFAGEQEWETLEDLGDNAEAAMKSNPEVFPRHWATRIKDALAIGVDLQAVRDELQTTLERLQALAKGLPDAIIAEGLPVPFADRNRLPTFRLRRQDAQSSGAVAEYARAGIRYSQVRSLAVFAETWQRGLDETAQEIEDGALIVDYAAWENFKSRKTMKLRLLPQRARTELATDDEQAQQFDTDMGDIVDAAGPLAAISMLSGLLYGSFDGWDYAYNGFAEQLGTANEIVAGGASDGRVSRQPIYVALHTAMQLIPGAGIFGNSDNLARMALGLSWGWEQGYLGAATVEALNDLMSHILTFLIETIAFLAAQEVPVLNVLVDIFAGYQMLELIDSFLSAYEAAAGAKRVGPLQHAGSRLLELIASTAVQAAAGAAVSAGFHGVRGIGKGAKDEPRVPGEEPGPAEPAAPARSSGGGSKGGAGGAAKGVLEENALAKKPVEGHEVVVTEEGVGICSPDPCPVIGVEYAQELADHPDLKEWNDQVQELRKTDPVRAAEEAARLVRTAEAARANAARAARAAGEEPIFTLGVGKDRMERIRTGERDFVVDRRMTFDIDEVLPVGESSIKPQRAVDRAMSAENRQLLDPNTNQRTKGLGIDPRELPANRAPRQPVSVTTNPHALLTHRFSEIPELKRIFDRAVDSVKNKGELRPTELKARINAETRRIITEDMGADAVAVRQALTDLGFVRQPNVGWVMTTGGMPQRPPATTQ